MASRSALALHQNSREPLTEVESVKLKAVARVIHHVAITFGMDQVRSWLNEPSLHFEQLTPLQMMKDQKGVEEV